jgi:imidazolonepropionase
MTDAYFPTPDLVLTGARLATFDVAHARPSGQADADALVIAEGRIAWMGYSGALPTAAMVAPRIDCAGQWITPALIDCHTHLVYAGSRAREFELRLHGASYEQIAREGGGIRATVAATRAATVDELVQQALPRLQALVDEGVMVVEIKSGYGLDTATELNMLLAARRLAQMLPVTVRTTFLGAHALPPDYAGHADDYIDLVCTQMLPAIAGQGLADAVDAFCENIGFTPAQTERVFIAARELGLPVKLHAEQLSNQGGAALVAKYGGLSADHLEHLDEAGAQAMAASGTVAVLLPGAYYFLRETHTPPIELLRRLKVPMAISTDINPGTSPFSSLLLMLNMACTLFRMTPEEALTGTTRNAARALGMGATHGTLAVGKAADLLAWNVGDLAELCYSYGTHRPVLRLRGGKRVDRL